jgi:DNA-binding NarL/FixJ family response regulator
MRILIADDHGIVREGLKFLIGREADMEVVGEAEDGLTAAKLVKDLQPDVVIMDVSMPNLNGIEATRLILHETPGTRIVALSMYYNRSFVLDMLKAGAIGYMLKSYLFDELVRAIRAVAAGEHYLSPKVTAVLIENYINRIPGADGTSDGGLTDRERQILQMLTEGQSVKQIALRLHINSKTADANRRHIMNKVGIYNIAELTKYAIREGLTSAEF